MATKKESTLVYIPILGTIGDNGVIEWHDKRTQHQINQMAIQARKRGYPIPTPVKDDYGHTRVACPVKNCYQECFARGYVMHYKKTHDTEHKREVKLRKMSWSQAAIDRRRDEKAAKDGLISTFDELAWKKRSDESIARLNAKYGIKKPII